MTTPFKRVIGPLAWGTGALNIPRPVGYHVDDILVAVIETAYGENISIVGWQHAPDSPSKSGVGGAQLNVLYRRATGSESAITSDSGDHQVARIVAFGGVEKSGSPWDVTNKGFTGTTVAVTIPGDTTTQSNDLVLVALGVANDLDQEGFVSGWTNADLTGIEELFDSVKDIGNGGGIALITGIRAAAGVVGSTTATKVAEGPYAGWFGALLADTSGSGSGAEVPPSTEPFSSGEPVQPPNELHDPSFAISTWQWDTPEPVEADRDPIDYYLAWAMMDENLESRNKLISAIRVTGKIKNGFVRIHAASPGDEISKDDIDNGVNFRAIVRFPDSTEVTRYERKKVKIRNLSIWTARLSGTWDGVGKRDRLEELVIEGMEAGTQK